MVSFAKRFEQVNPQDPSTSLALDPLPKADKRTSHGSHIVCALEGSDKRRLYDHAVTS